MSYETKVDLSVLDNIRKNLDMSPEKEAIKNAILNNGINKVAFNNNSLIRMQHAYSHEIKTGKITAQEKSGRCWIFAGSNMLRTHVARNFKIKDFELSENYIFFWDKFEKSNYFLEKIIETADEHIYSRIVMWLLAAPMQDGGQWDMFSNLIKKYGVVPKHIMPETFHSSDSQIMDRILTTKLREYAKILRNMKKNGSSFEEMKQEKIRMLSEVYNMLVMFLGTPPEIFDFEYSDDDGKFHQDTDLTPGDFFNKYVNIDLYDYISIINAPSEDKPFHQPFTVKCLGNVIEGREVFYLNVDRKTMKELTKKQLLNNEPVWFGCDVGKMSHRDHGILDSQLYLYGEALGVKFNLDKGSRLEYGESLLTHAMLFTGVNVIKGKTTRWKVENSWGPSAGKEGFFVMGDKWFDDFTYQVVIRREYLSDELLEAIKKPVIELEPWDPMGALAIIKHTPESWGE